MSNFRLVLILVLGVLLIKTVKVEAKCNCQCPLDYRPVCAEDKASKDKDTFNNECMLQCYNCTHDKNYVILSQSACDVVPKIHHKPRSKLSKH